MISRGERDADVTRPVKLGRELKQKHGSGGFRIEILHPGLVLDEGDSGVGAIGRIDHARVTPGTVVAMHPHRDDEILTYLRTGRVRHEDTVGHVEEISSRRMMMMNAGHRFQHEETVLGSDGVLTGLQIFLRPSAADLEPQVQFHDFTRPLSDGAWRILAGPAGQAPLVVRAQAWVHDARLEAGRALDLPPAPPRRIVRLLYMFAGSGHSDGVPLSEGESLLLDGAERSVAAETNCDLILLTTDLDAPVFKGGMFSGNMPPPR